MTKIKMKSGLLQIQEVFAIKEMPWVVRAYFFLFLMLVVVLFVSLILPISTAGVAAQITDKVLGLFELVIGAVLGSLSMAAERTLRVRTEERPNEEVHEPNE